MKKYIWAIVITVSFSACDILKQAANEAIEQANATNNKLTEQEVIQGLKEALDVGTGKAVSILSKPNGYLGDAVVKIMLPPDAQEILKHKDDPLLRAVNLTKLVDDVVTAMNRSAEDAAKDATPIFKNAIKAMTIQDAWNILKGSDTAATHYFRQKTYNSLIELYKPIMSKSLNKPLVAGVSANTAWKALTSGYNQIAKTAGWRVVNTDLVDYATRKGVDGLFIKIAAEESRIRHNPSARINDILRRVFDPNNW